MDGAIAFHLIERHADNWSDAGKMMHEWARANSSPAVAVHRESASSSESRRLVECEDVLRSLASWLGVGGFNAPTVDPQEFEKKIRWGVDHQIKAQQGLNCMTHYKADVDRSKRDADEASKAFVQNLERASTGGAVSIEPKDGGWYLVRYEGLDGVLEVPAQRRHNHWNSVSFSGIPLRECEVVAEILITSLGGDRRVSDPDAADILSGTFMISRARSYEMMADALNASGYWVAKFTGRESDDSREGGQS
jgi:hypothetical protein